MTKPDLDLDALRAATADETRKPLTVKFGGETYKVSRPMPLVVSLALIEGDFRTALTHMFGDKADEVLAAGIDMADLRAIADSMMGGQGEADASPGT